MDEARRRALEAEFDEKSAELSGMMEQVDEVQRAYARLALALRARAVKEKENAAREETVEMERMLARCQQAKSDLDAAKAAGDARPRSSPSSWPSVMSATPAAAIRTSCAVRAFPPSRRTKTPS